MLAALALAAALAQPQPFTWRCQVQSVGPPPDGAPSSAAVGASHASKPPAPPKPTAFRWTDGLNHAIQNGTGAWTPTVQVSAKNLTAAKKLYPNADIGPGFPGLVLHFSVTPAANLTTVNCQWSSGKWSGHATGRLFGGGTLGAIVSTNAAANPVPVSSFADFNKARYGAAFAAAAAKHRPVKFPVVDRWIGGDNDLASWQAGIDALSSLGLNGVSVEPISAEKLKLLTQAGQNLTSGAGYSPACGDSEPCYNDTVVAEWAAKAAAPYAAAGVPPNAVVTYALADEPGWYWPSAKPNVSHPAVAADWASYLTTVVKLPASAFGAKSIADVPISPGRAVGGQANSSLPQRRTFYWTMRYSAWRASRHFAKSTAALETAFKSPGMGIYTNFNNFAARLYVPGPIFHNNAKTDPNAAMLSFDWFEFARERGSTLLWTEDWFGDTSASLWSFLGAKLRSAVSFAPKGSSVRYGGYIVPRSGGQLPGGLQLKALALVGGGAKALKYFTFGPEYNFPGNCYSERLVNDPSMLKSMSSAHTIIAAAEPLLWPGARPAAEVAVLYPRSSELWDEMGVPLPSFIADATENYPLSHTTDYFAEVYGLYDALAVQGNVPVDFVDEDGAADAATLSRYRVVVVTEPNVPAATLTALLAWGAKGGTLVFVGNAATADEYDTPTPASGSAQRAAGAVGAAPSPRTLVPGSTNVTANVTMANSSAAAAFPVRGPRGNISSAAPEATVVATFQDGTPAVVRSGSVFYAAFWPGLSHVLQPGARCNRSEPSAASFLDVVLAEGGVKPPASVDLPCVETPVLSSAAGAAVTVLDWGGAGVGGGTLNVTLGFAPSRVASAASGELKPLSTAGGVTSVALPQRANTTSDIILFYK